MPELEFDELPSEEIRPGDLVFVLAGDDPLEQLVAVVNGTYWCHVGVACGDGLVASSRSDTGLVVLGDGGGVRLDPLSWYREELGRPVFVGRVGDPRGEVEDPRFAPRRDAAAEFGRLLGRAGTGERTRFSFTKTVVAGLARRAGDYWPFIASEGIDALLDALDVVGESWAATPAWPVFASAEFVATAYGLPFRRAALQGPLMIGPPGPASDADVHHALGVELIREQEPGRRCEELARLLEIMERWDSVVLRPTVEAFCRWYRRGAPGPEPVPLPRESPKHEVVPGAEQPIAPPLVSARLLSDAWWVEKIYYAIP